MDLRANQAEQPTAKPRHVTISKLLLSQVLLGLLVAITTGMLVWQSREQALTASRHELQSLALTLADQAERAFDAVDLLQTTFIEMTRAEDIKTPEEFRRLMSSPQVNAQLIEHGRMLPQLDTIALVDADGNFINFNHALPVPPINIADRPHFRALRDNPGQTSVISEPIMARLNNSWAVVVAHRITSVDGRFLGISFGGVVMRYFENLYQTVGNGEDTAIALSRQDGVLLARYPSVPGTVGKAFTQGGIVATMAESGASSEVVLRISQLDGVERLIAGRTLSHFPFVVSVSTSLSAILQPWRRQAVHLTGAAIILELVLVGVGILMQRQLRAQRQLGEARAAMAEAEVARRDAEAELALGRERERADQKLQIQAVRFDAALGNMSEVLCLFDDADRLMVGNDRLGAMLELPGGSIAPGMALRDIGALLTGASGRPRHDPLQLHSLILRLKNTGRRQSKALDMQNGRRIAVNFAPMDHDGWLVTLEDITEQRRSEAKIEHMAQHDALTGLPNRALFHLRLDEAVARCRRGERCAVLYLDLDHFKAVNDTLGHPVGDALLCEVTQRLKVQVREIDTIARLGGDEFAIVQSISQPSDSTALARRVIEAVSAPYEFNGNRVIIGASIGIAVVPNDGENVDEIVRNADMALYTSKANGRGRYQFFEAEMDARMQARRLLDLDLRKALADSEFRVYYQPLIAIATGSVCGFEALVRWEHPQQGMVSPADFIPLAEEIGLIVPLGKWVLRQACADAATWPQNLKVAVNLSPVQLGSPTVVEDVAAALADAGLPASRLELEITETAMLADTDAVLVILHQLRDLGLGIALDDFGTGYSSLSYLQRFPFNKVKIDRSFVARLGQGGDTDTIVAAVIDLCGRLRMMTTGEGVETPAQLRCLESLRCVEAQGYLFSRPRPAADVAEMLLRPALRGLMVVSD
jgi:diguanylate cyclase (GGDEF)-like protein